MLQQFQNHIEQHFPFLQGKKLLLAVSGGVDSMVLLRLFENLSFPIGVAHCNFHLRGEESDKEAFFVESYCKSANITFYLKDFDTAEYAEKHKISIQIAARNLRYEWFDNILKSEGYDYLLTAHHLDDSVETFLINFTRGTGIEGLLGIPRQHENVIRPLLAFSRTEIEAFAQEEKLTWQEDSSNASDKYWRNKIRHHITPILKELNPNFLDSFQKTVSHLQNTNEIAQELIHEKFKEISSESDGEIVFDIEKIQSLKNPKVYLYEWLKPYGFKAWNDIEQLLESETGKQIYSEHYRLLKNRKQLVFGTKNKDIFEEIMIHASDEEINFPVFLSICQVANISNPSASVIFVDKNSLKFPLKIRKWQEGDYFYPSGMKGKKKVSKYFKDEKFSLFDKENTWLLCQENEIIWIMGHRADNRFIATKHTQQILKIELLK